MIPINWVPETTEQKILATLARIEELLKPVAAAAVALAPKPTSQFQSNGKKK